VSPSGPGRRSATVHRRDSSHLPRAGGGLSGRRRAGPRSLGRNNCAARTTKVRLTWHPRDRVHARGRGRGPTGRTPMEPPTAEPAAASGTLNPLCRVLFTLRSIYLCAIGPVPVVSLATDTPRCSSCSPKQFYSWARTVPPGAVRAHTSARGCNPLLRAVPGYLRAPHHHTDDLSVPGLASPFTRRRTAGPLTPPRPAQGRATTRRFIRHY